MIHLKNRNNFRGCLKSNFLTALIFWDRKMIQNEQTEQKRSLETPEEVQGRSMSHLAQSRKILLPHKRKTKFNDFFISLVSFNRHINISHFRNCHKCTWVYFMRHFFYIRNLESVYDKIYSRFFCF